MHTLGWDAHYNIPGYLQQLARDRGLEIQHHRRLVPEAVGAGYALYADEYRVRAVEDDLDVSRLCPSSIPHENGVFSLPNLHGFLEFLHQPVRASVAQDFPAPEKPFTLAESANFRERARKVQEQKENIHRGRTSVHRMLRFAVTGSVEIPPDEEEGLAKESAECHAKTEQAMRDEDTWRIQSEFGNPEESIASIPGTKFDPKKGFSLVVDDTCLGTQAHAGAYQRQLNDRFWGLINQATNGRYAARQKEIHLSGAELEEFCKAAHQGETLRLIDGVEFEEAVHEKLTAIKSRLSDLPQSMAFSRALSGEREDPTAKLRTLMDSTSSLTPVVSAQFMRDAWTRYNFTERHQSPLEGLSKEFSVFMAVADLYASRGHVTPLEREAIACEFRDLLAFSSDMAGAIDNGLAKEALKNSDDPDIGRMRKKFSRLKAEFEAASVSGVSLGREFMSEEKQDVLRTLEKHAGKPGPFSEKLKSVGKEGALAGSGAALEFTGDVITFLREDPRIAAGFLALAATMIAMKGGDPNAAASAAMDYSQGLDFTTGLPVAVNASNIPTDLFGNDNFHWDLKFSPLKGYELYKHFANANFIVGPSQKFMEWIRENVHGLYAHLGIPQNYESAFDAAGNSVIQPLADRLFMVNMLQNASHAAFWMYTWSRGFNHGTNGFGKLFELAAPVTDLGYQAGVAACGSVNNKILSPLTSFAESRGINPPSCLQFRRRLALSERLMEETEAQSPESRVVVKYEGRARPDNGNHGLVIIGAPGQEGNREKRKGLLSDLAGAAEDRAELEGAAFPDVKSVKHKVKIDQTRVPYPVLSTIQWHWNPFKISCKFKEWKAGGLTREFQIGAHNLRPTLDALDKFDLFMQSAGSEIESDEAWHLNMLSENVSCARAALKNYTKTGDAETLKAKLDESLETVLGAEMRYRGGTSEIYSALFEGTPDKKTAKRLIRTGKAAAGRSGRQESRENIRADMRGEGEEALTATGHLKARAQMTGINLWGGMVGAARASLRGTEKIINKKTVIIGSGVAAVCAGMDLAGVGNEFSTAVSAWTGRGVAGSATVATFLNFNFWEDIIGVHVSTGVGLVFTGAAAGHVYRKKVKPAAKWAWETSRDFREQTAHRISDLKEKALEYKVPSALSRCFNWASRNIKSRCQQIAAKSKQTNERWGHSMTKQAMSKYLQHGDQNHPEIIVT